MCSNLSYEGSAQGKWLHTLYDAPDCEYKPEYIIGGRDVAPAPACVYQIFKLYEEASVTYDGHQLMVHPPVSSAPALASELPEASSRCHSPDSLFCRDNGGNTNLRGLETS